MQINTSGLSCRVLLGGVFRRRKEEYLNIGDRVVFYHPTEGVYHALIMGEGQTREISIFTVKQFPRDTLNGYVVEVEG